MSIVSFLFASSTIFSASLICFVISFACSIRLFFFLFTSSFDLFHHKIASLFKSSLYKSFNNLYFLFKLFSDLISEIKGQFCFLKSSDQFFKIEFIVVSIELDKSLCLSSVQSELLTET